MPHINRRALQKNTHTQQPGFAADTSTLDSIRCGNQAQRLTGLSLQDRFTKLRNSIINYPHYRRIVASATALLAGAGVCAYLCKKANHMHASYQSSNKKNSNSHATPRGRGLRTKKTSHRSTNKRNSHTLSSPQLRLLAAAEVGDTQTVKQLINTQVDLEKRGFYGTPLATAARYGHDEIVELLINAQANIEARHRYGETPSGNKIYGPTPLMLAAEYGHIKCAQKLINGGAQLEDPWRLEEPFPDTALTIAASKGHTEIVKLLIDAGPSLEDKQDGVPVFPRGVLAMNAALAHDKHEVVQLLVEAKVNPLGIGGA